MFGCKNFPPELGFFGGRFTGHVIVVVVIYLWLYILDAWVHICELCYIEDWKEENLN